MKIERLESKEKGWFIGDFPKATFKTPLFEVAYKTYKWGDKEDWHVHRKAREITLLISGVAAIGRDPKDNSVRTLLAAGDILLLEPGEGISFEAQTDCATIVVKTPSVPSDKYSYEDNKALEEAIVRMKAAQETRARARGKPNKLGICTECGETERPTVILRAFGQWNEVCSSCLEVFK